MSMQKLPTKPLKGFRDFTPEEWQIQKYLFDIWTNVCKKYGYQEYNGPVLESIDIYNKSGDDVGTTGKEIYSFEDRGGRKIALRPEMTPTVGRMIAEYGKNYTKPIRWFSIAQFFRAENPQRGRGREFFQLNFDLFGSDSIFADVEIIKMAIDIMLAYGATEDMFVLYVNNRKYMNASLLQILEKEGLIVPVIRVLDRLRKVTKDVTSASLKELELSDSQINSIFKFIEGEINMSVEGADELQDLLDKLDGTIYKKYIKFDPALARGFDYYTGMVFEVFDKNPQNNRSMFGGGRYDNLVNMFSNEKITAVGCAPGDVPARLFLESWDLLKPLSLNKDERYYFPLLSESSVKLSNSISEILRNQGKVVIMGLGIENLSKSLSIANRNGFEYVVVLGEDEISKGEYKLKDMKTGKETVNKF